MADEQLAPIVPDYGGGCLSNVVPVLLERPDDAPGWMPAAATTVGTVNLPGDHGCPGNGEARR